MEYKILITLIIFILLLAFNYLGAVGRIERKNKITGKFIETGPVSKKEEIAFFEGRHKILAFYQSLIASIIYSLIAFGILSIFF